MPFLCILTALSDVGIKAKDYMQTLNPKDYYIQATASDDDQSAHEGQDPESDVKVDNGLSQWLSFSSVTLLPDHITEPFEYVFPEVPIIPYKTRRPHQ